MAATKFAGSIEPAAAADELALATTEGLAAGGVAAGAAVVAGDALETITGVGVAVEPQATTINVANGISAPWRATGDRTAALLCGPPLSPRGLSPAASDERRPPRTTLPSAGTRCRTWR